MIFDVILVIVFILLIVINIHRGALRALAGILASVIAYIAATALGTALSGTVYDSVISPGISKAVAQAASDAGTAAAGNIADALPKWLSGLIGASDSDLSKLLEQPISGAGDAVAQAIDAAVRPIAIGFLTILITLILFLIFFIILRFLFARPLSRLAELPVINGINRFFGGIIGFIDAFLLVSMAAYLIRLILSNSGTRFGWLSESTIYNSFIFYHFYSGNIFTWLSSLIGG